MRRRIIPYNSNLKELARQLRNDSTPGEIKLWEELKIKQFYGYDFDRQKPLLSYIVDFYCNELNLVIEIDGVYHEEVTVQDEIRTKRLIAYNLTVLRFTEQEIHTDLLNVFRTLEAYVADVELKQQTTKGHTPNPSQEGKHGGYQSGL